MTISPRRACRAGRWARLIGPLKSPAWMTGKCFVTLQRHNHAAIDIDQRSVCQCPLFNVAPLTYAKLPQQPMLLYHK